MAPDRVSGALEHALQGRAKPDGFHPRLTLAMDTPSPRVRVYSDAAPPLFEVEPCKEPAPRPTWDGKRCRAGHWAPTSTENAHGLSKEDPQATGDGKPPPIRTEKDGMAGGEWSYNASRNSG